MVLDQNLINKIVGFNAHAVVKPYDKPLVHKTKDIRLCKRHCFQMMEKQ